MSDWYQIESGQIIVQVTTKGAELKRLFNKIWNKELLWSGDEKVWNRSAPILFPIVGGLKDNEYIFDNQTYTLPRHGFARDCEFVCTYCGENELKFKLVTTKETYQNYPFIFELYVDYLLHDENLKVSYRVKNLDTKTMYFSIGSHPAFDTRQFDHFELRFEKNEDSMYYLKEGLAQFNQSQNVTNPLPLAKGMFSNDALIFKKLKSKHIELVDRKSKEVIKLTFGKVPFLGIWGPIQNQFVCIEPWFGVADTVEHDKKIENKLGIHSLRPSEIFECNYEIELSKLAT